MQACILKLILDNELYDAITDSLLTFPHRTLDFVGHSVQAHTQSLNDLSEQVSGFKQKMVIEINTTATEAGDICRFIQKVLPQAEFDTQLFPLMSIT